jgi:hypothetical protein
VLACLIIRNHNTGMDKKELQERLKKYAIAIVKFSEELPDKSGFRTVKNPNCSVCSSAAAKLSFSVQSKVD